MPNQNSYTPLIAVLSGALVWGLIWYPYRVLQEAGVSGTLSVLLSYSFAMLWGAFVIPKIWQQRAGFNRWVWLLILSAGWTNLAYVLGVLQGEVMRVLLLFYLAPLWTILFARLILKEKLNRYGYAVMFLSLSGAATILWRANIGIPIPQTTAEWLGLSAGMSFALANVTSRHVSHLTIEAKSFSLWLGTLLLTLLFLLWQGGLTLQISQIPLNAWLLLAITGATLCGVSFAIQYGLAHMPANRAVVLFLFELVVAAIAAWILVGEAMNSQEWLGAALIISATLLSRRLTN